MAKYLATYSDTIDDIEVTGFSLMTDKEMERFEDLAISISWYFTYVIGDYEIEYSSGEDLLTRIDFREISNEEYKILNKVFDEGFGVFITEDYLLEVISEEEDEEEIEDEYERDEEDDED